MGARRGQLESDTSAESKGRVAPARRYASFVVRGWQPGATGTLEVAHDQSGERVQADSLIEAIDWIQSHSMSVSTPVEESRGGEYRAKLEAGATSPMRLSPPEESEIFARMGGMWIGRLV